MTFWNRKSEILFSGKTLSSIFVQCAFIFFFCDLIFTVQKHYYYPSHPHFGFKQVKRHRVMSRAIMLLESSWSVRGRQTTAQGLLGKTSRCHWLISTRDPSGAERLQSHEKAAEFRRICHWTTGMIYIVSIQEMHGFNVCFLTEPLVG